MRIEKLSIERVEGFLQYCRTYGALHDESFVGEGDLKDFTVNDDHPTFLLIDEETLQIVGAASLMFTDYFRRGNRARLRIFHCIEQNAGHYGMLAGAIQQELKKAALDHCFFFVPIALQETCDLFDQIGFITERYVYYMERALDKLVAPTFPDGLKLLPLVFGKDEASYVTVRNAAFAGLIGSSTPVTIAEIADSRNLSDYIEDGLKILWDHDRPIGIVAVHEDEDDHGEPIGNIGPIAVLKEAQGKGLGKNLLRAGLMIAQEQGYKKAGLSVNAENKNAARLYVDEGFQEVIALACYLIK